MKWALLEALFRGDGHNGKGALSYATISPVLAFQTRDLLLSLGIHASIRSKRLPIRRYGRLKPVKLHGKILKSNSVSWAVSVHGDQLASTCEAIGMKERHWAKGSRRGSKFVRCDALPGAWFTPVTAIGAHRSNLSVHDLQIDGSSESFVAGGIVVHNCPLEALACGVPVCATACTGHSEYLSDGHPGVAFVEHGPLAPMDDFPGSMAPAVTVDAIGSGLTRLYANWTKLAAMAEENAEAVRTEWAWEKKNAVPIRQMLQSAEYQMEFDK
jgi:glycosyltransferase involved in cell wall biosynthesis